MGFTIQRAKKGSLGKNVAEETRKRVIKISRPKSNGDTQSGDSADPAQTTNYNFVAPSRQEVRQRVEESASDRPWTPREGENHILVLPAHDGMEGIVFPWADLMEHYIGGNSVLAALGLTQRPDDLPLSHGCRKFYRNEACAWDDFIRDLRSKSSSRNRELARSLSASIRGIANIVDLAAPRLVRRYRFPEVVREELLRALDDGDFFCNHENLMKVRIKKTVLGKEMWEVRYKANVLHNDTVGPVRQAWLPQIEDLSKYLPYVPSNEEINDTITTLRTLMAIGSGKQTGADVGSDMPGLAADGLPF